MHCMGFTDNCKLHFKDNCKQQLLRKDLTDHLTQHCPLRKYKCQHCEKEDTYKTITEEHYGKCPNYPLDCPNTCGGRGIKRAEMTQHRSKCPLEPVECSNKCNKQLLRKDLTDHLTQHCPLRKYKCQHCGQEDTYQTITEKHYDECPNYPLDCPNTCGGRGIKRAKMSQHRSKCPLEPVECPNYVSKPLALHGFFAHALGFTDNCKLHFKDNCKQQLLRKDLTDHLTQHCPLRKYKCQHCEKEDTYKTITEEHYGKCPNYPLDCPNTCGGRGIKRAEMTQHRSKCPLEPVECSNKCNKQLLRKDLTDHLTQHCPLRKYKCQHCGQEDTYQTITEKHYDECPNYPLDCPNTCGGRGIKRAKMSQHRSKCPLEPVECPNYVSKPLALHGFFAHALGFTDNCKLHFKDNCKQQLLRKDLTDHLTQHCPLRKYKCQHCEKEDTYKTITEEHYGKCPNYPLDCPNTCGGRGIKRAEMTQHRSKCPLEPVECSNKCNKQLLRKDLTDHLTQHCPLRKYKCQHCGQEDTYQTITEKHYDECPNYPLDCPNTCGGRGIKRAEMSQHRSTCPLEPVECPFKEAGCQATLVRRELDSHVTTNQQQHLLTLMAAFREVKAEFSAAKEATKVMQEVIATDVAIIQRSVEKKQSDLALASITSQLKLDSFRLKYRGPPLIIRMINFSHYQQSGKVWHSPPFYRDPGYKMQLAVYAKGTGAGASTHVSIALLLMKGELDHQIPWPVQREHLRVRYKVAMYCCHLCPAFPIQRVLKKEGVRELARDEKFVDHQTVSKRLLNDSIVLEIAPLKNMVFYITLL